MKKNLFKCPDDHNLLMRHNFIMAVAVSVCLNMDKPVDRLDWYHFQSILSQNVWYFFVAHTHF